MHRDPETLHVSAFLAGSDSGAYSLPPTVTAARGGVARITSVLELARRSDAQIDPATLTERLSDDLVEQAFAGEIPAADWTAEVEAAEHERRTAQRRNDVAAQAHEKANVRLREVVMDEAETIVVEHLRPALDEVLAVVRSEAPHVEGLPLDEPEAVLHASDKARKSYFRIRTARDRYDALRTAQRHLGALGAMGGDGECSSMRNPRQVWEAMAGPGSWMGRRQARSAPWPDGRLGYLVWAATTPIVELWIPLPHEQEQAERELFASGQLGSRSNTIGAAVHVPAYGISEPSR